MDMHRYKRHSRVEAFKISKIEEGKDGIYTLTPKDKDITLESVIVGGEWVSNHQPKIGMYISSRFSTTAGSGTSRLTATVSQADWCFDRNTHGAFGIFAPPSTRSMRTVDRRCPGVRAWQSRSPDNAG